MTPARSSLNAARRARELAALPDEVVDVLVIGLGATGAGVALDAAARGLSVAAIDAFDLAFGTSRWSSKLIHGGLRYLASGQVAVARESAAERGVLMTRTAPHLVRAMPFVMPFTEQVPRAQALLSGTGLVAGDLLRAAARTPRSVLPGPRPLSAARVRELAPPLRPAGLRGGMLSWDGRVVDDARLVTAIARTAAAHGARVLTRCRALTPAGDGAEVRDELTGRRFTVRARAVVNATGVWAGELIDGIELRPSRGTHLVLRDGALPGLRTGLHIPIPGERARFVLVIPQDDGRVYVGLTDDPVDGPVPDVPQPADGDVEFLLGVLGSALDVPLRRADVAGAFAGLRPLLAAPAPTPGPGGARTADLSRRHAVITSADGVVTVVGGKLTTYRQMAEDAVDAVLAARPALSAGRCRTAGLPLVGAGPAGSPDPAGVPLRLTRRYGAEAPQLAELARDRPELLEPVAAGRPELGVELLWGVRHEGALDAADLLDRRTRIGLVAADRAAALPAAQALFTPAARGDEAAE